jgi:hypothetical protein
MPRGKPREVHFKHTPDNGALDVNYSHFFCDIFTPWRRPTERWANLIVQFVQRCVHGSLQKWDYQLQIPEDLCPVRYQLKEPKAPESLANNPPPTRHCT